MNITLIILIIVYHFTTYTYIKTSCIPQIYTILICYSYLSKAGKKLIGDVGIYICSVSK